ncbi:MAG TPA: MoaD/ThiS family protein [Blastocatellia bacterium]|nr:MoaD/ThiS family protein [Blastocatellia bacterium]
MAKVVFTSNLQRFIDCPSQEAAGGTVREVLDRVFEGAPRLRGYILDDQDQLRTHVHIFVDGELIVDRVRLSDAVRDSSELYVMQALSGG